MKASELKTRPVISLNDGRKVGVISDVTLDATNVKLGALLLVGSEGSSVVPFLEVRNIGADAVTIDDSRRPRVTADQSRNEEHRISALTGLSVVNQEGTLIGYLEDLELDDRYGRVTALLVQRGGVLGMGGTHEAVPVSAIRGVGSHRITVDTSSAVIRPVKAS
jgi:sporulation protein YlmC with PRC-barrel domain